MKQITNLINHWKIHGWKKTKADWYYNFVMLETPEQTLKKQILGYCGSIIGMIFAIVVLIYKDLWYITIAMAFMILIQYASLKQHLKQKQVLKDIKNKYENLEEEG